MRVLTIDVDYITTDYSRYNEFSTSSFPQKKWDDLFHNTPVHPYDFKVDSGNVLYIIDIFTRAIENCKNVVFGRDHESILYELEDNKEKLEIINIDQHHDIAYSLENIKNVEKYNIVDEGSWIWYLYKKKLISSYTWIGTETSEPYNHGFVNSSTTKRGFPIEYVESNLPPFNVVYNELRRDEFNDWRDFKFDLIYISESPDYIFPEHWFYSDVLKIIYKNKYQQLPRFINNRYYYNVEKHKFDNMF